MSVTPSNNYPLCLVCTVGSDEVYRCRDSEGLEGEIGHKSRRDAYCLGVNAGLTVSNADSQVTNL